MKRYAMIGLGGRSSFFYTALAKDFVKTSLIVGFCDTNQTRMNVANDHLAKLSYASAPIPTYKAVDFDKMIEDTKPDEVIITTMDQKPMTIDEVRCKAIIDAVERTGKKVRVTFNYRYAPHNTKVFELLGEGAIGQVNSIHFEWALNTSHGADYFRRWHRDKRNAGGLLVHKSTHHFDLINFWLRSSPVSVVAQGGLMFYGRENAEKRGVTEFYTRAHGSEVAKKDPFALHLEEHEQLRKMYLEAEHEDSYYRDQSVFGDGISIEDTMGVLVKYGNGAILTYSLIAYSPWEGFRAVFNGTKGRLELDVVEMSYVNSGGEQGAEGALEKCSITLRPLFEKPREIEVQGGLGGHGGGDPVLLNDLFGENVEEDRFGRAADHIDGARSILTGIAANKSLRTEGVVWVKDILDLKN
ncbi:putative oxidoreductase yteT [Glarea lozoyensis 74030]|uniref:Putative oxidoreductase yteT n=1 Tax=Glarea lozoyensis (strain ATCC 74030 / MF5533) TaxID=1104152 RepID=H0EGY9_GLAL7|nr:putative oxidoreductase yteT [Glarea lozoyensis 74030]